MFAAHDNMKRSNFFLIMSSMYLAVVLIGFSRTLYLSSAFDSPELPIHLILHGIVLTIWFLLATVQPYLVASNRTQVHKQVGKAGYVIAITLVALSVLTVAMRDAPTIDEFPFRGGPNLYSLAMFLSCAILGLRFRNKPEVHKRLMLMASIPLLAPAMDRMARIPAFNDFLSGILFWFPDSPQIAFATLGFLALIITVVIHDLFTERKVHRGTLWGLGGMFVLAPAVTAALTLSGAWAAFVQLFA